jgi:hypothetical protein
LKSCPSCGAQVDVDAITCPSCGHSLAWASGPARPIPPPGEPPTPARSIRTWAFVGATVGVVGVIALAVFLAGRSAEGPASATPAVPATLDPGWTTATEAEDGFSIGLPRGWEESQFDVGESIKFQAIDGSASASRLDFVPNVNVIAQPLPFALSLDDYLQANLSQLETQLKGVTALAHQRVTLPVGPAERIQYRFDLGSQEGEPFEVSVLQFVFIQETTGYIITFETAPPEFSDYRPTFEQMAQSFRFTD